MTVGIFSRKPISLEIIFNMIFLVIDYLSIANKTALVCKKYILILSCFKLKTFHYPNANGQYKIY